MKPSVLTPEHVAKIRSQLAAGVPLITATRHVIDSHEALRSEVARLQRALDGVLAAIDRYRSEFGKTELWKVSAYKQILDIIERVPHV